MLKVSILILLFVVTLFRPVGDNKDSSSIDLLRTNVQKNGWNNLTLYSYQSFLLNSPIDITAEKEGIKKLPVSFERTFLTAILNKRNLNFKEMFDSLYSVLGFSPDYLYYYDELTFVATATSHQSLIKTWLEINKTYNSEHRNYLLGLLNLSTNNSKDAISNFSVALSIDSLNPHILYQLSFAYRDIGDYPKALEALKKSYEYNKSDQSLNARNLLAQGSIYYLSGKNDEAEKFYHDAFNTADSLNDLQTKSRTMVNLGIIQDVKGDNLHARNYFEEAQKTASGINDLDDKALALSELGVSYSFTNNLIEAKNNYLKSYELFKTLGNKGRLSYLSDNIGKIYMTMFDYTSALRYYQEGLQFSGDNKRARVLNLIGLADVYSNLSNYTKAIDYYKQAQDLSSQINEISLKADIDKGMGILNFNLDKFENASHYFYSYSDLSKKTGDVYSEADAWHKIGICLMQLDSLNDSGKYLMEAAVFAQKSGDNYLESLCYTDLSSLFIKSKNLSKAEEYLAKAKSIASKWNFDYLNANIELIEGDISNNFGSARKHYEAALSFSKKINDLDLQIAAYNTLAQLFAKNNLPEAADSYFNSAIDLVDNASRPLFKTEDVQISYFSSKRDVYSSYADFLLSRKKYDKAFEVIDNSRSRNLLQNLTNLKLQSLIKDENTLNRIYEYDWMIHSGIYNKASIDSITLQFNLLKKNLIAVNKELTEFLGNKSGVSISGIQKKLNDKENILSLYTTANNTYVFLLNKKEFRTFETGLSKSDIKKLLSSISPYYRWEENSSVSFYNQDLFSFNASASYNLYNKLLKEALDNIPKQEKIIIIPSSELIVLPFDFLVSAFDNKSSPYSYKDKHFLLYDYDFSYTTSASAFTEEISNHLSNSNKSLLVGDPSINTHLQGYSERRSILDENPGALRNIAMLPLKYSREEVSSIGKIVNADKVLTDSNATESNFKKNAEYKSIIHLSTHSFLFNKQPVIFFSNLYDPDNDGFLEAGEIVQLKLNSDLVVLSSCNSGLGRVDDSEGILGMSKAFFEAGAKSIVVSLWEVNDRYTSKLMTLFYRKLNDGLDKSEALRQAKIQFIKEYSPNPYYWGAFVLSGDISKVPIEHHFNYYLLYAGLIVLILIIYLRVRRNNKINKRKIFSNL